MALLFQSVVFVCVVACFHAVNIALSRTQSALNTSTCTSHNDGVRKELYHISNRESEDTPMCMLLSAKHGIETKTHSALVKSKEEGQEADTVRWRKHHCGFKAACSMHFVHAHGHSLMQNITHNAFFKA